MANCSLSHQRSLTPGRNPLLCVAQPPLLIAFLDTILWLLNVLLFVVAKENTAGSCYCSLRPKVTIFKKSHRGFSLPEMATIYCSPRPQHLKSNRETICNQRPKYKPGCKMTNNRANNILQLMMAILFIFHPY